MFEKADLLGELFPGILKLSMHIFEKIMQTGTEDTKVIPNYHMIWRNA